MFLFGKSGAAARAPRAPRRAGAANPAEIITSRRVNFIIALSKARGISRQPVTRYFLHLSKNARSLAIKAAVSCGVFDSIMTSFSLAQATTLGSAKAFASAADRIF